MLRNEEATNLARWGAIMAAIAAYQARNPGNSPGNGQIARDTGLSPGQVQYHLALMSDRGMVSDNSEWPRVLKILPDGKRFADPANHQEEDTMEQTQPVTPPDAKPARKSPRPSKRLALIYRAQQFARVIDASGKDKVGNLYLADATGMSSGGTVPIVQQMVENGWVAHQKKRHGDISLTDKGRAELLDRPVPVVEAAVERPPVATPADEEPHVSPMRQMFSKPVDVVIRRVEEPVVPANIEPEKKREDRAEVPYSPTGLAQWSDLDLLMEANRRGYRVVR